MGQGRQGGVEQEGGAQEEGAHAQEEGSEHSPELRPHPGQFALSVLDLLRVHVLKV